MDERGLNQSIERLRADGAGEATIATFADQWRRLAAGESGVVTENEIEPVGDLPRAADLAEPDDAHARAVLSRAVMLRLNGGLGTSMGMTAAKSLLEVKDGLTFLDVIARQVLDLRARYDVELPLVLLNSFRTREDSLKALVRHAELAGEIDLDILQSRVPKLRADDLRPVDWPADPELQWAPPGHGDLYATLHGSGMLDALRERGIRWMFAANADNLGAMLDPAILAWMADEQVPFAMEVAVRTAADRKGGHLVARRADGHLLLRESAQTREEDLAAAQDIDRHRYFNTNSLWIDLDALDGLMTARDGVLGLPMIVNRKTADPADPADPASTPVLQLETAMGAAIGAFDGARALQVTRARFAPVKTTDDLLVLRSDAYTLDERSRVIATTQPLPLVNLDPEHFKLLADFEARFPDGAPSLIHCDRLDVEGDVTFGAGVTVRGSVALQGPARVDDGTILEG